MIIGTAGHIDHGKTSLVKALTGIDTDRLPEEKRRGITLELGFAHLELGEGLLAGVVDVPGHERFVKAMAAGAGGVDLAILVVAADEGAMPQTREHLDICGLLGVRRGVLAINKSDLLTELGPDWLGLLQADLASLTRGTFLEGAKIVPCSAKTGEGLPALREALLELARALPERPSEGPAFLPIDRAFTMKGFGTVVTGTLLSGQLEVEDSVSLSPELSGPFRVRGLQVHGRPVERASAGQRVAVNLAGVETEEVWRGMALTRHEELPPTRMLDVELSLLPAVEASLPRRSKHLLHLGTAQVEATVALLGEAELRPGQSAFAQLRLSAKVAALPNQRFILRGSTALPGRGATLAGGRVLAITPPKRKRGAAAALAPLLDADSEGRLSFLLEQSGYPGLTEKELFARSAMPQKSLSRSLELLCTKGKALLVDKERRLYLSGQVFSAMGQRAIDLMGRFHDQHPMKDGLSKEELRQRLGLDSERIFSRLVASLLEGGKAEAKGELLRLAGRGRSLSASDEEACSKLVSELTAAGLAPPTVGELSKRLSLPQKRLLELLKVASAQGLAIKVTDELYFDKGALERLRGQLVSHLRANREITTQAFKEMVGQTRKFVIPLSEYFDREKVTLRVGDKRVLRGSRV
ncbi:MAG: selenocysteine-specific translation elongation factor [Myxococcales bacterium]|nr:selenocysteine-specific translation elongation factor [Myxococcales bacterium]